MAHSSRGIHPCFDLRTEREEEETSTKHLLLFHNILEDKLEDISLFFFLSLDDNLRCKDNQRFLRHHDNRDESDEIRSLYHQSEEGHQSLAPLWSDHLAIGSRRGDKGNIGQRTDQR
jgi:hypothetical protein